MSQAAGPLNAAIRAALVGDATLVAFLTGDHVFSEWLPPTVFPDDYLVLGSDDATAFGRFNKGSELNGLVIHGWSKVHLGDDSAIYGKAQILTLAGHVSRILQGASLTLAGYGTFRVNRVDLQATVRDVDGLYYHSVQRLSGYALAA